MWGPLLALALLLTINPLRIGIILLVLSRPRPMQNLFAYWVGTLLAGLFYLIVPLIVLHSIPASAAFTQNFIAAEPNPIVQRVVVAVGVILLALAALMAARSRAQVSSGPNGGRSNGAATSTATLDPATMPIISRLVRPATDEASEPSSWFHRLLRRAREAWQTGSPWIALVIGLMVMPADGVVLALALIVASGATVGMQLSAAIAFVILVLAVEETILISNLLIPKITQTALQRLHEWAVAHHRKFMAAILALVGISLVIHGAGVL